MTLLEIASMVALALAPLLALAWHLRTPAARSAARSGARREPWGALYAAAMVALWVAWPLASVASVARWWLPLAAFLLAGLLPLIVRRRWK